MKENQNSLSKKTELKENNIMEEYDVESKIKIILDCNKTWTIKEKMPLLLEEIEKLKNDMKIFLSNTDFEIPAILDEAASLREESQELIEEMKACQSEIENETMAEILETIENHDKIAKELETVKFSWLIVYSVIQCGNYIKIYEEGKEAKSYSQSVDALCELLCHLNQPVEGFEKLDLYTQTKSNYQLIFDKLCQDLYDEWDKMISHTTKSDSRKTIIILNLSLQNTRHYFDILNALYKSQKLSDKCAEFAVFILKEVILPVIKNESSVECESAEVMTVSINHNKPCSRPNFRETISKMKTLLSFINTKFGVQFTNGRTLMGMFGKLINIDFCNFMVNECFIRTIPNNLSDLQSYYLVTAEIQEFQRFIKQLGLYTEGETLPLLSYMENIDVLFANSSSQYFLDTARTIMLKDLNVTMSIGLEKIPEEPQEAKPAGVAYVYMEEALDLFEKTIPNSLYYFPRCLISCTAQELLDLVYVMMEQAVQCSEVVSKKLYHTARLTFELYDAVVPYHNENYLLTIPHFVALFHNNCMYLAHNLQTLGDKWLNLMEGRMLDYAIGFLDLVQKIRELGYRHLAIHMQQQRKQILDNIRSSDLNCIVVKDVLDENAEAAVRQCLRQLLALKNVWIGVFPSNVFTKLIATLVNMFVDELIHRVCTVEDISMEMATQLTEMYTLVVQKAPQLFITPTDVDKYVKSWIKLQELIFVLSGSLKDIENHWNEGTGPLAVHFKVDELRSLIKALFQNTQFRASLLSKIK
ncbi:centromere/kinetochore protein zw10 homolog [Bicyclus anynana]|uniref:Centromere/kinetochore protein zw10 homolog n=1 Tax=Bicyclus anynana TaxID=110368 RepID=A0A6J1MMW2_BICAN|nr:centromere/kinetochore protein zw10 homolog [Bicyclus anynana]